MKTLMNVMTVYLAKYAKIFCALFIILCILFTPLSTTLAEEEKETKEVKSNSVDEEPKRRSRPQRGRGRRFSRRPRVCQFCVDKTKSLDYKQVDLLKRYVTDQGKIRSRRETGACAKHQRMVAKAVKRARHMALLPFAAERYH